MRSVLVIVLLPFYAHAWNLVWNDEFDGDAIDESKWTVYDNMTHGNQELQLYNKGNVWVTNGTLVLQTRAEKVMYGSKQYNFTSGWVETQGKYHRRYGRFSIRAKLPNPAVKGIWPAHWMKPEKNAWNCWPTGGEIDIMEATGGEVNNTVYGTFHYGANCSRTNPCIDDIDDGRCDKMSENDLANLESLAKARQRMAFSGFTSEPSNNDCTCGCGCDLRSGPNGDYYPGGDESARINFSEDFHIFTVEWSEKVISWFVDSELYWQRSSDRESGLPKVPVPNQPFFLMLNTAIDWWNPSAGVGPLPTEHVIDWVRVYSLDEDGDADGHHPPPTG